MVEANFITITGMDGVGKTTLARWLVEYFRLNGSKCKYVWIRYQHTLAYLLSQALKSVGWIKTFNNPNGIKVTRFDIPRSSFATKVWPFIEFISVLPLIIFKVKLPMFFNYKIVCDRYTIDTIVSVTLSSRNQSFSDSFIGKLLLKMIPKGGIVLFLDADMLTVLERRPDIEYSDKEITEGMELYRFLTKKMNGYEINVKDNTIAEVRSIVKKLSLSNTQITQIKNLIEMKNISVIIPTCNRSTKLKNLLNSIIKQRYIPTEVIIVDQSDDNETYDMVQHFDEKYNKNDIQIKYFYLEKKSISKARNLGIENSTGEIVFLIDDDVVLMNDYVEKILEVYKQCPDAIGVQGNLILDQTNLFSTRLSRIENQLRKIFYLTYFKENTWSILPSINDVFPSPLTKIIPTQRFQGICSYKKNILEEFKFDEKLEGWSFLEDFDLSYRIYKSKKGSLYITPEASLVHNKHTRTLSEKKIESYKKIINRNYMFNKLIKKSFKNYLIFYWSIFGLVLTTIFGMMMGKHKEKSRLIPIYMITAIYYSFKYSSSIKKLNLEFLNTIK